MEERDTNSGVHCLFVSVFLSHTCTLQMLENWIYDEEVLKLISGLYFIFCVFSSLFCSPLLFLLLSSSLKQATQQSSHFFPIFMFYFCCLQFFSFYLYLLFFLWFHELITIITGHYQTGETLPGTWRQKLLNAKVCCLSFVVFVVWFDEVS